MLAAYSVVANGLAEAEEQGNRARFLTLTDQADGAMDVAQLYRNFTCFKERLRRKDYLGSYCATVEVQKRGALHLHVILVDDERGGGFIAPDHLEKAVVGSGFGKIHKIMAIKPSGVPKQDHLAQYLLKETAAIAEAQEIVNTIARYCSKSKAVDLEAKSKYRLRPFRVSRNFPGVGLTKAEEAILGYWYPARDTQSTFEVWKASEVGDQLDRLERMERAAEVVSAARPSQSLEEAADRLLEAA
jgi:hypothetical protein